MVKIIAEIGVNHNGDMNLAKQLILCAKNIGADYVKFQTYKTEHLVAKDATCAKYQQEDNQYNMLKRYELSDDNFIELAKFSNDNGIIFISTPFDCDSVDLLEKINVPLYKISSGDINNYLLLRKIKNTNKPIIISSGMSNLNEIQKCIEYLNGNGKYNITLMHCVSSYPTKIENINMINLNILKTIFNVPIGLSDHSELYTEIAHMSVAMECVYIEKHLTLDKNLKGPDHKASLDPLEFKMLVDCTRMAEIIYGTKNKDELNKDDDIRDIKKITKRLICAKYDLYENDIISYDNIVALRGIIGEEINIEDIIGRKIIKKIKQYDVVNQSHII